MGRCRENRFRPSGSGTFGSYQQISWMKAGAVFACAVAEVLTGDDFRRALS